MTQTDEVFEEDDDLVEELDEQFDDQVAAALLKTTTDTFTIGQLVEIEDRVGFFQITKLPSEGSDTYTLYGGRVTKRGGPRVMTVSARMAQLKRITNPYTMRRAVAARRVVADVMAEAPRPHAKKAGKK